MKHCVLTRFAYGRQGTFGELIVHDVLSETQRGLEVFRCYTVERPWLLNKRNESCIPEGSYDLNLDFFDKGGYTAYQVKHVPDRSEILIHVGNTMEDVSGCIAVGTTQTSLDGMWAVGYSKVAFRKFMAAMRSETGAGRVIRYDRGKLYVEFSRNIAQRK